MRRKQRIGRRAAIAGAVILVTVLPARSGMAAPSYAVSLSANPTTTEVGSFTTLTVVANQDLGTTKYTTYLFDQTDPTWYRACKARTCSFQTTSFTPGTHSYIAYIARDRNPPRYPPMQVQATSNTVAVTWTASTYAVGLAADRTWLAPGATSTLTAQANKAVDGTVFDIQIFDLTAGVLLASCSTGSTCEAGVSSVSPATRTYQAFVAEPGTAPPPPHVQASSNVVSVTWSVLPDPSRPPNIGGGPIVGSVVFAGDGVPPIGSPCAPTSFEFTGSSTSAWLNGSGTAYVGPISISAAGGSICENAQTGAGAVTVNASGSSDTGDVVCGPLVGTVTRILTDALVVVTGNCTINQVEAFRVRFIAKGEFVPPTPGDGVTAPVREAQFGGAFVIIPD